MTRRITRVKKRIETSGEPIRMPVPEERAVRLAAVLHVLYLIFTEGYAATAGPHLVRLDLSSEAIRLTRIVHRSLPSDAETAGLLALMLLTDNPIVALNHAVAVAMARGPAVGLDLLARLAADDRVSDDRRFHAVRAHLL